MIFLRSALTIVLTALMAVPAARASLVSYNFTASIAQLAEYDAPLYSSRIVTQATAWGQEIDSRQAISGTLRYDTQAAVSAIHEPGRYFAYLSSTLTPAIVFTFANGPTFQTESPLSVQVADNALALAGADVFYGHAYTEAMGASIALSDASGLALNSAYMPMSLEGFPFLEFRATWGRGDGGFLSLIAAVTSWEEAPGSVNSVPEPSSSMLAIAGLCLALRVGLGKSKRSSCSAAAALASA